MQRGQGDFPLVPTYRLPTLIHSRSANAKWLVEISNRNPLWMHTSDAKRLGFVTSDLARVNTEIGYFVARVWATEGMRPGVVACSHHIGRWRRSQDPEANRWATNLVDIQEQGEGKWKMNVISGIKPAEGKDKDLKRIFWRDGGVHQNITHAVHPDPISGMHCWASEGTDREGTFWGSIWGCLCRYHKINGSLPSLVGENPSCARTAGSSSTTLAETSAQAC